MGQGLVFTGFGTKPRILRTRILRTRKKRSFFIRGFYTGFIHWVFAFRSFSFMPNHDPWKVSVRLDQTPYKTPYFFTGFPQILKPRILRTVKNVVFLRTVRILRTYVFYGVYLRTVPGHCTFREALALALVFALAFALA